MACANLVLQVLAEFLGFYYAFVVLVCIAFSRILGTVDHWAIEVSMYVSWHSRVCIVVDQSNCVSV